eukprot:TRINITY_DN10481_c0_g1_i1.p1 TRINITY_DN10481_c0_g1~~TRINITY_DN10481_c0_g1_i1.p1  ORF type:complete len:1389 (-),score=267.20 TRINITY_DN10481_c0_g1_i1:15-4181(-)
MSFCLYKQSLPPTSVEHCVSGHITSADDWNLLVGRTTSLSLYRLNVTGSAAATFELICSSQLNGTIESIAVVRFAGDARDSVLLTLSPAKISVLEYDAGDKDLKTVKLNDFEPIVAKDGWSKSVTKPRLCVDPQERCAVVPVFDHKLMVLAFRRPQGLTESADGNDGIRSSFPIDLGTIGVTKLLDVVFLHGYYQPTILILYQEKQTWAGRLGFHRDTCAVKAVSLDLQQQEYAIIWTMEKMPYSSFGLVSIPSPIGGALILSPNIVHHINQHSVHATSVNGYSFLETNNPFAMMTSDLRIALDACHACVLKDDCVLFSLKTGELYVMWMIWDGRSVTRFEFFKTGSSVLTSCLCTLGNKFVFLGSRLGDSLLLAQGEAQSAETAQEEIDADQPSSKRVHIDEEAASDSVPIANITSVDVEQMADDDVDAFLLGIHKAAPVLSRSMQRTLQLSVCDALLNVGPVSDFAIDSTIPTVPSEDDETPDFAHPHPRNHLIAATGFGKNGALCILESSILPVPFMNIGRRADGIWQIPHAGEHASTENLFPRFVFISMRNEDKTMILATKTGDEDPTLEEISDSNRFLATTKTLCVGAIHQRRRVVQVYATGIKVIADNNPMSVTLEDVSVQDIVAPEQIVAACVEDPHVLLLLQGGDILLYTADTAGQLGSTPIRAKVGGVAASIFRDTTGLCDVVSTTRTADVNPLADTSAPSSVAQPSNMLSKVPLDEDDMLLLSAARQGPAAPTKKRVLATISKDDLATDADAMETDEPKPSTKTESLVIVVATDEDQILILSVPTLQELFKCGGISAGSRQLLDGGISAAAEAKMTAVTLAYVGKEFPITCLGVHLSNGEVLLYEGYKFIAPTHVTGRAAARFKRIRGNSFRARPRVSPSKGLLPIVRFVPFSGLAGERGIFVAGTRPCWIMGNRGSIHVHEMSIDGPVTAFSSCYNAFMYASEKWVRACSLPPRRYDLQWPLHKVLTTQRRTIHCVVYHPVHEVYLILTSHNNLPPDADRVKEMNTDLDLLPITDSQYSLQMVSPADWSIIDSVDLDRGEQGVAIKAVKLLQDAVSDPPVVIAVGTVQAFDEDIQAKGRVIFYEPYKTTDNDGKEIMRLKQSFEKEMKGAVTFLSEMQGYLIVAVGPKLMLYSFRSGMDLVGQAFFDAQTYITDVTVVKNFLVVADMYKSVQFVRLKDGKFLSLLAKDFCSCACTATGAVVNEGELGIVASDANRNFHVFGYDPTSHESYNGQKLLNRAQFHTGALVTRMKRVQPLQIATDEMPSRALLFGTAQGSLGYIAPVPERTYRRLYELQAKMITALPHVAGLNPKAFRAPFNPDHLNFTPHAAMLDGDLLFRYLGLDVALQRELARMIGTTKEMIVENLLEVDMRMQLFSS